jgi:hypothetical protein
MIQQIIAMLQLDNHYGISEEIEIAKGKYKLHTSMKKAIKQGKRELKNTIISQKINGN